MKQFEVTITARRTEFFPAEDEQDAERQMVLDTDPDWMIDNVEVIELDG